MARPRDDHPRPPRFVLACRVAAPSASSRPFSEPPSPGQPASPHDSSRDASPSPHGPPASSRRSSRRTRGPPVACWRFGTRGAAETLAVCLVLDTQARAGPRARRTARPASAGPPQRIRCALHFSAPTRGWSLSRRASRRLAFSDSFPTPSTMIPMLRFEDFPWCTTIDSSRSAISRQTCRRHSGGREERDGEDHPVHPWSSAVNAGGRHLGARVIQGHDEKAAERRAPSRGAGSDR